MTSMNLKEEVKNYKAKLKSSQKEVEHLRKVLNKVADNPSSQGNILV